MWSVVARFSRPIGRRLAGGARASVARQGDADLGHRLALEDVAALRQRLSELGAEAAGGNTPAHAVEASDACAEAHALLERDDPDVAAAATALSRGWQAAALAASNPAERPPDPRAPCFFDPRHGMATEEILWTTPRRGTRTVPVCGADAVRLEEGIEPGVRKVEVGGRRTPYYDAGESVRPYLEGYFPSAAMEWARTSVVNRPHIPEGPRIRMGGAGGGPSGDGAAGGGIG